MLKAIDPATGTLAREVPTDTDADLDRKLDAARAAYESWRRADFATRGDVMRNVARLMRERADSMAAVLTEEMGKVVREARGEIEKCAATAEHFAEYAERYLAREVIESDATLSYVQHLPLGAVLGILPWNSPFWLAFRVIAPAAMAGNVCLIKSDSHVPGCAQAIGQLFAGAAPPGLVQSLLIKSPSIDGVIRDPRIDAVSFTGSTSAGAKVAAAAAAEIKPAVLELGGSDAAIVLADADLAQAADTITLMRIIAAGQSCIATKRILVEAPVYDRMLELLEARMAAVAVGDPRDPATDVGPLARADLRDELHRQVSATIAQGARRVLGGEIPRGPGWFYPVTLLADVTPDMTAFREETFGPVATVTRADDADHAVALANRSEYGLAGSLWTTRERGEALAGEIVTGQLAINGLVKSDARLPSGGVKRSGYGKELGPHGIREFVNSQQVWVGPKRS